MTGCKEKNLSKIKEAGLMTALRQGGPMVWLSCLFMGAANLFCGQIIKGLLMLGIEAAVIFFLVRPYGGLYWLSMLPSLGWVEQQKVWNEEKFVYEYVAGDQSQLILLYGVATAFVILLGLIFWRASVRSGYQALCLKRMGRKVPSFLDDCKSLFDENVHKLLMTPPMTGLLVFTPPSRNSSISSESGPTRSGSSTTA